MEKAELWLVDFDKSKQIFLMLSSHHELVYLHTIKESFGETNNMIVPGKLRFQHMKTHSFIIRFISFILVMPYLLS